MAFKLFVSVSALLAVVNAGALYQPTVLTKIATPSIDAVASTHQNVVRSFDGTVSNYSKQVHTPYSSVTKVDSRTTNNVYTPALTKTVTYASAAPAAITKTYIQSAPRAVYAQAAPVLAKTVTYASTAPAAITKTYIQSAPRAVYAQAAPVLAKTVTYASTAPAAITKTYIQSAPRAIYTQSAPALAKTVTYAASAPTAFSYRAPAPQAIIAQPAVYTQPTISHVAPTVLKHAIAYSPAVAVSHVSFDGFGTHWGF